MTQAIFISEEPPFWKIWISGKANSRKILLFWKSSKSTVKLGPPLMALIRSFLTLSQYFGLSLIQGNVTRLNITRMAYRLNKMFQLSTVPAWLKIRSYNRQFYKYSRRSTNSAWSAWNSPSIEFNPITWAKNTPKHRPIGQRTPVAPCNVTGASSVRYIGVTAVMRPETGVAME